MNVTKTVKSAPMVAIFLLGGSLASAQGLPGQGNGSIGGAWDYMANNYLGSEGLKSFQSRTYEPLETRISAV